MSMPLLLACGAGRNRRHQERAPGLCPVRAQSRSHGRLGGGLEVLEAPRGKKGRRGYAEREHVEDYGGRVDARLRVLVDGNILK